jgi:phosphatidylglycerophosphate synthase
VPDGAPAPRGFDAVLVVDPPSEASVAGLRLVERSAWTVARAGAGRLLCVGRRPAAPLRLPEVPIAWAASIDAPTVSRWMETGSGPVVVLDAATVVDRDTITALVAADGDGVLDADGAGILRRCPRTRLAAVLAVGCDLPDARLWTPPAAALMRRAHDAAGRRTAARALFASLGRPGDGWFTRHVDRRISRVLTRLLLPTGVTPNQVTLGSITIGFVAGALFATGSPADAFAGSLVFLASTIVDGCDGELARLTFRESAFGAKLDVIGDNVVHVALFAGIAAGLYRRHPDPRLALVGAALVIGVLAAMAAVYVFFVRGRPSAGQRRLFEAFASREFAYLLVALTVAGRLEWFLWASVCGTYAFVAGLLVLRPRARPAQNA